MGFPHACDGAEDAQGSQCSRGFETFTTRTEKFRKPVAVVFNIRIRDKAACLGFLKGLGKNIGGNVLARIDNGGERSYVAWTA